MINLNNLPAIGASAIVRSVEKTNNTPRLDTQRVREAERIRQIAAEARRRAGETKQKR